MVKKFILLIFTFLLFVGCDWAMDSLDVVSGTKYIVTSKKKEIGDFHYVYHLIKVGDSWYDYYYPDTTNFNIGDTLVLTIKKVNK